MTSLIFAIAFVSLSVTADEKTQQPPSIDPKFDVAPGPFRRVVPNDGDSRFKLDEREGRCYFIATRPVKPGPDEPMVRNVPSTPPIDNMPVVKPGPTCSAVR